MLFKTVFNKTLLRLRAVPKKYLLIGFFIFAIVVYFGIFSQRALAYSYSEPTCTSQLIILPGVFKVSGSDVYDVEFSGGLQIGGHQIVSTHMCISPNQAPQQGSRILSLSPFGGFVARLSYKILVPDLPKPELTSLRAPISANKVLKLPLDKADTTFSYIIKTKAAQTTCSSVEKSLICDIPSLKMGQGEGYDIALERQFESAPVETLAERSITTLSPVTVIDSTIKSATVVFDKPTSIILTADKELRLADFVLNKIEGESKIDIPISTKIEASKVSVELASELPRLSEFEVSSRQLEAVDGSLLPEPYSLRFNTSGGPSVTGVNTGQVGLDRNATIVISFDQDISESQDIASVVSVKGVDASLTKRTNSVIVQLANAPACADFTISVSKDITSKYDIAATSGWSWYGRTICQTVSVAGYSSEGRPILAYEFGTGSRIVLFVGAIHGDEYSTLSLMQQWINELEANVRKIPSDKRIVVVPQINPDGVARGGRLNARNVDLNRNFATTDWQRDVTNVNNEPFAGGGGESAMSEPESQVMAALAQKLQPELTLSYHSIGGLVAANQIGRSASLATIYSQSSGYSDATGMSGATFEYSISGTWDDWLAERLGAASILIELGSHSYHQIERNRAAMWAMVGA